MRGPGQWGVAQGRTQAERSVAQCDNVERVERVDCVDGVDCADTCWSATTTC